MVENRTEQRENRGETNQWQPGLCNRILKPEHSGIIDYGTKEEFLWY